MHNRSAAGLRPYLGLAEAGRDSQFAGNLSASRPSSPANKTDKSPRNVVAGLDPAIHPPE